MSKAGESEQKKKQKAKEYEAYAKEFTPKPAYVANGIKAFLTGGAICCAAFALQNWLTGSMQLEEKDAKTWVTVTLICTAQLLTGFGLFDSIAKFAGAGCIVPITGFANAIEYKKEGPVLGVGAKLFSVAGPVLVCGIFVSIIAGIIQLFR